LTSNSLSKENSPYHSRHIHQLREDIATALNRDVYRGWETSEDRPNIIAANVTFAEYSRLSDNFTSRRWRGWKVELHQGNVIARRVTSAWHGRGLSALQRSFARAGIFPGSNQIINMNNSDVDLPENECRQPDLAFQPNRRVFKGIMSSFAKIKIFLDAIIGRSPA
jgi:hypothetical protein